MTSAEAAAEQNVSNEKQKLYRTGIKLIIFPPQLHTEPDKQREREKKEGKLLILWSYVILELLIRILINLFS